MPSNLGNPFAINRRAFLGRTAGGTLGMLALADLLGPASTGPSRARDASAPGRAPGRAKQVICLFQNGGPSQMALFDPKPALTKYDGKPFPGGKVETLSLSASGNLLASPYKFAPAGESGIELSELLPHTAKIVDEMTLIRSMSTESVCHEIALRLAHSGNAVAAGRPTLGAWITYALGSENGNLPAFVVLPDAGGLPING
ncbi:MAG: DUF1501 domain-containing protein, partial [Singulisphaera sp.]